MAHWGSEETRWCSKEKGHKDAKKAHWGFEKSHRGLKDPIRLRKGALGLGINCLSKTPSPAWKSFEHALPCSEKGFENAQGSSRACSPHKAFEECVRKSFSKKPLQIHDAQFRSTALPLMPCIKMQRFTLFFVHLFVALPRKSCSSKLCPFCTQSLRRGISKNLFGKTLRIHHALFRYTLLHFIPCIYMHGITQKHFFSCSEKRLETLKALRACSTHKAFEESVRKRCSKRLFSFTTLCFTTLCSTSPVHLYARDHTSK